MVLLLAILALISQSFAAPAVSSDAWVGTDALGRSLPEYAQTGAVRPDRFVALFYWTWHGGFAPKRYPKNIAEILAANPKAIDDINDTAWGPITSPHFWSEPLFGYYNQATDPWVLRKHAQMLAEAGVDVIIFDCTNGSQTFKSTYEALLEVFAQARKDGIKTPQIAFILPFADIPEAHVSIRQLYQDLYKPGLHKDLWFMWKDKPLIMGYPEFVADIPGDAAGTALAQEIRAFFTFRPGQPAYNSGPSRTDHWGWLEIYPQHGYGKQADGSFEEATVGVAQNWNAEIGLAAMNAPKSFGRSYTVANGQDTRPNAAAEGLNFKEQWDRALTLDPHLIFITGWNEWVAGRFATWLGREPNAFPDEFSPEKSRDIEPMKGGFGDNYYMQMIANIRKYKGLTAPPAPSATKTIAIDGDFSDWTDVGPEYRHAPGSAPARDYPGYKGTQYTNLTGRNDFTLAKVARDGNTVYFYVQTAAPITLATDKGWMRLFLNLDRDRTTGWEGYNMVVNRKNPGDKAWVEQSTGGWKWIDVAQVDFRINGNQMELAMPRSLFGPGTTPLQFEFKWSDNMQADGEIMDFYVNGDVAPSGRFNFLFKEAKNSSSIRKPTLPIQISHDSFPALLFDAAGKRVPAVSAEKPEELPAKYLFMRPESSR